METHQYNILLEHSTVRNNNLYKPPMSLRTPSIYFALQYLVIYSKMLVESQYEQLFEEILWNKDRNLKIYLNQMDQSKETKSGSENKSQTIVTGPLK